MTKKDFELIASVFQKTYPWSNDRDAKLSFHMWNALQIQMATALLAANPRFNLQAFTKACHPKGVDQ